jgi:hypothetical protein
VTFFFECIKQKLTDFDYNAQDDLKTVIAKIFDGIDEHTRINLCGMDKKA